MRRPSLLAAGAVAAVGLFAAGLAVAAPGGSGSSTKFITKLNARSETPRPKGATLANGLFTANLSGSSLTWRLTFSRLTGRALAAHIHLGKRGVAGPVAVPLCGPCVSGVHKTSKLTSSVRAALMSGRAYVNVHTAKNPAGEIRGQVAGGRPGVAASTTTTTETQPTTTDDGGYGGYGGYGG
jgi:CHRD domain-containing protein